MASRCFTLYISVPHRNTFNVLNAYKVNDDTRACNGVRDNGVNHFNDTRPIRQVTLAVRGKGGKPPSLYPPPASEYDVHA
nr:MAG TPA: hypothetical protein [Caudoviricetes sp.]